jgi:pimeloyl-ACP methyl ester carboxylesterase
VPEGIHVEETGDGPPLVALHGFGASSYTWREMLGVFSSAHRVYAVDLKGSGQSIKPGDGRYSMRDQAALVLESIAERRLTGITLVGHSFGSGVALLVALELIRKQPGTLDALILFAAPAYRQKYPWFIRLLRTPLIGLLSQWLSTRKFQVRRVLKSDYYNAAMIPDESVSRYAAPLGMPGGRQALRETARQVEPPDIDDIARLYPSIDVPTLLIWGVHDRIVPLATGVRLKAAIPRSHLIQIFPAGHVPHEETPALVRPAVAQFLADPRNFQPPSSMPVA